jgi:tellurium resistance protein TerD
MGILGKIFGKKDNETAEVVNVQATAVTEVQPQTTATSAPQLLNLKKGDILDLTKYTSSLTNIRAAAGWDINKSSGSDYDLDLCAYLFRDGRVVDTVYYGNKHDRNSAIWLDGDNLTGSGEGDDENIRVDLTSLNNIDKITFAVVIYHGKARSQSFNNVKNAYVRLVDESAGGKEICRYCLSTDGGSNTAVTVANIKKDDNQNWVFEPIGIYSKNSIDSLKHTL